MRVYLAFDAMNKKGFEFSFSWLFAILAGATILFLAVYGAVKIAGTSRYQVDTMTAKQLSIIFEPMETGLASAKKPGTINLKDETRVYNKCFDEGNFGMQKISLSSKIFGGWKKPSADIPITNKYVFSSSIEQGKSLYLLSKTFKMPFKVSELIFMTSKNYCFVNAPEEIKEEISGLELENIKLDNCTKETKVCFSSFGSNCEIKVSGSCPGCNTEYDKGMVSKDGETIDYASFEADGNVDRSLMYAAIFSDKKIYECNFKRLMKRLVQESLIYEDEADFLTGKCGSSINLIQLIGKATALQKSYTPESLNLLIIAAEEAEKQNEASECKLW